MTVLGALSGVKVGTEVTDAIVTFSMDVDDTVGTPPDQLFALNQFPSPALPVQFVPLMVQSPPNQMTWMNNLIR
ncbi:MAG: hypothetical protein B7Z78_12955 [Rhodospirillales bacterium 20-60-12]|nr:MAG: hypothetical protein B7Z78_12955 [Rhodospirillales bacterium 20-60-12]